MKSALNPSDINLKRLADLFDHDAAPEDIQFNELHLAVLQLSSESLSSCLLRNFHLIDVESPSGQPPLGLALERGDFSAVQLLLQWNADIWKTGRDGSTCLHYACRGGCETPLRLLLEMGLDPTKTNHTGDTPLHTLAWYKHEKSKMNIMINLLLEYGADINASTQPWRRRSPASKAAQSGNLACLEACIARGADVNLRDSDGWNVLAVAVQTIGNRDKSECIKALLDAHVDIGAILPYKMNILHKAALAGNTASLLALSHAESFADLDPEAMDELGRTPQHIFDWDREQYFDNEDPGAARTAFDRLLAAARRDYVHREPQKNQGLPEQKIPGAWPY